MPTYEYQCSKCQATIEVFQSMKDSPLATCPKDQCARKKWGKGKVRRLLGTGAGLIFKGSGFYITDYRTDGYKAAAKQESGGGTESKPAEPAKKTEGQPSAGEKPAVTKPTKAAKKAE
jgi:putative FmdB family regulatory protein